MECTTESCKMEKETTQCPCGSGMNEGCCDCSTDPVHHATKMWSSAFFDAMHQAQVQRLQKRIDANFGPTMDKVADVIAESFGKIWQSMLLQAEAKQEIESKLQKIYSETSKR